MFFDRQAGSSGPCGLSRGRTLSRLWSALACLTFFAFAGQAYLTQTHEISAEVEIVGQFVKIQNGDKQDPGPEHGTNCPLCQTIAAAGAYLSPATASLPLPGDLAARADRPQLSRIVPRAGPNHLWHGRAPPLA